MQTLASPLCGSSAVLGTRRSLSRGVLVPGRTSIPCRPRRTMLPAMARVADKPPASDASTVKSGVASGNGTAMPIKPAKMGPVDGNEACARIAYAVSDVSFIYPITPATPMGELVDQWSSEKKRNVFGNIMQVTEMESEAGVAGALHGALAAGALATTFTCSQGLLLMIPNMYKIAGELIPCVLHVTARALAGHALSIFGDHQDVMAVRSTGWTMLSSHSVQEAQDLALAAHLATLAGSVPIVHFFDGFRTSHEINKISLIDPEDIKPLVDELTPAIAAHHARALNPSHPHQRGTAQGPDVYMQALEAANPFHQAMPEIVQAAMDKVAGITGRQYHLFDYVGDPEAEDVVVAMGSGCGVLEQAVGKINRDGGKVGLLKVHLFRPWSGEHLLAALPASAKRLTVMDRTKEHGSGGEPLLLDVAATLQRSRRPVDLIIGGRYGLGSKDFTPAMALAVFENMTAAQPVDGFTVGIADDVTFTSLPYGPAPDVLPEGTTECQFWGMGSDGTVGANKEAVKIIANRDDMFAQAYFSYDAKKSGGVTVSHLRFGPETINAPWSADTALYIGVHQMTYWMKFDVLAGLHKGGKVLINAPWTTWEEVRAACPPRTLSRIAELRPTIYCIDAASVAREVGLGRRVNMVMQSAFFALSGVMDINEAIPLLKKSIQKAYSKKGEKVVQMNYAAVDAALERLVEIQIPQNLKSEPRLGAAEAAAAETGAKTPVEFLEKVVKPMLNMEGDKLPVSVFAPGGFFPPGTTAIEKRTIAAKIPKWISENCTQCNICAFVCPHAAIRPSLSLESELATAPPGFQAVKVKAPRGALSEYQFRIQVSPRDCTGCDLCTHACPDNALVATPLEQVLATEGPNWDFFQSLPNRGDLFDKSTIRGSQFQQPLVEFSGACEGCGETPYVKLLTQMFGTRMVIANATGCSSIWGGSAPANPYTINQEGKGPAWANSLFEDNAQFGFGIGMGLKQRRNALEAAAKVVIEEGAGSSGLRKALEEWLPVKDNGALAGLASTEVQAQLQAITSGVQTSKSGSFSFASPAGQGALDFLENNMDLLDKPSVWIVGGDGWAYDIGYAGLDHVMSTGEDVNVLVLDTEEYSNTGGQKSKSTPLGAVVKFASGGKMLPKKELGLMTMTAYPHVYVASVSLEASYPQVIKALAEAEAHPGPSLIIAYAPCAMQGMVEGMGESQKDAKLAVDSGYWPLYRYLPAKPEEEEGKLVLDSKKIKGDLERFLQRENRFNVLVRKDPETAETLHKELGKHITFRHERLTQLSKAKKPEDQK